MNSEQLKTYGLLVVIGVPLVFHVLFRFCGRMVRGCQRTLLAEFLIQRGGFFGEVVRSTEWLFTAVIIGLFAIAALDDVRERLFS